MENLEGATPQAEGVEPIKEVNTPEEVKPTEPKVESTVRVEDTPEFRSALDKALGKGLESTNRQLSLKNAEAARATAEAELHKATLARIEEEKKEILAERDRLAQENMTPEELKGYRHTMALEERERKARLRDAEQARKDAELEDKAFRLTQVEIALEIQKEYKVPNSVLQICTSEQQMRDIAQAFPKVASEEPIEEVKTPKFDSGQSSGSSDGIPLDITKFNQWLDSIPIEEYNKNYASKVKELRRQGKLK